MNADRRKLIKRAIEMVSKAEGMIQEANEIIQQALDEENEYLENLPENLRDGEKGERAQAAASAIEEAQMEIEGMNFDEISSQLETASE
jgi:hypothetical protein